MNTSHDPIITKLKKKANRIYTDYLKGKMSFDEAMRKTNELNEETTKRMLAEVITKVRSL